MVAVHVATSKDCLEERAGKINPAPIRHIVVELQVEKDWT